MQIIRTLVWVLLLFALLAFSFFNWKPVEVTIWTNLVLETKLPALVIISFLLGLVPMWLVHRGSKWRMTRRISALETATSRLATPTPSPSPTSEPATAPEPAPATTDAPPADAPPPDEPNPVDPEPSKD